MKRLKDWEMSPRGKPGKGRRWTVNTMAERRGPREFGKRRGRSEGSRERSARGVLSFFGDIVAIAYRIAKKDKGDEITPSFLGPGRGRKGKTQRRSQSM